MEKNIKPKIYILPGWGHLITDPGYKELVDLFSQKYTVVLMEFNTRNPERSLGSDQDFSKIIDDLILQLDKPSDKDAIFGFSIGALLAYELASRVPFDQVMICSIAPCLGKDLSGYSREENKDLADNQYNEMSKIDYGFLKNNRAVIFYGEKESTILINRSIELAKKNDIEYIMVNGGDHILNSPYLRVIKDYFFRN